MSKLHLSLPRAALIACLLALTGLLLMRGQVAAGSTEQPALQATTTSSSDGQLQLPTATATPIGGATATPTRTPTFPIVLVEAVERAKLRTGPGLGFDTVGELLAGDSALQVLGRSVNYPWYMVAWPTGPEGVAWVHQDIVSVIGDILSVPIVQDPIPATVDPTQAALLASATVLLQTPGAAETATAEALIAPTGIFTSTPIAGDIGGVASAQFTPPPLDGQLFSMPDSQDPTSGAAIPPALVIITLGGLGIVALAISVLRRT